MKTFYLLRHNDVHGNSGIGVVAEGIIFDSGMCAMTWLSDIATVTTFRKVTDVEKLHGHDGKTQVIIEGNRKQKDLFVSCRAVAREKKSIKKLKAEHKKEVA